MSARPRRPHSEPSRVSGSCLYLGCFFFDEPGEPGHTGSFQVVVEADGPDQAADRCRARLRHLRTSTTLFDDPITIFLDGIIQLAGSFARGLLVNWESTEASSEPLYRLTCSIPEQQDHEAADFGVVPTKKGKRGEFDDQEMQPFLDFGGESFRRAIAKTKPDAAAEGRSHSTATSVLPLIPTVSPRGARGSALSKEAIRAEKRARKERKHVLAGTVNELRGAHEGSPKTGVKSSRRSDP